MIAADVVVVPVAPDLERQASVVGRAHMLPSLALGRIITHWRHIQLQRGSALKNDGGYSEYCEWCEMDNSCLSVSGEKPCAA
jgi:hypothetical protein